MQHRLRCWETSAPEEVDAVKNIQKIIVFDNRILYSRVSLILLFLPLPLPDIVSFVSLSMIMFMY